MKNKIRQKLMSYVGCLVSLFCLQCTLDTPPKINYDQVAAQLMTDLKPQLVGTWKLRQVRVSPKMGNNRLNLTKDSTFQDLATMTIVPALKPRTTPTDPQQGEYDGTIQYKNKTYPIQFDMWPGTRVYNPTQQGPQAFLLFSYHFPDGIRYPEPEETFLEDLGLIYETFSLETDLGQPTMKWVGLNRGIQQIDFVKQP
ncbi:hypothetical protein [Spirosoma aerophilum]